MSRMALEPNVWHMKVIFKYAYGIDKCYNFFCKSIHSRSSFLGKDNIKKNEILRQPEQLYQAADTLKCSIYGIFKSACVTRNIFFPCATAPSVPGPPRYWGFTITLRHTKLGRTPPDEWLARRRNLYLKAHITHWPFGTGVLHLNFSTPCM